MEERDPAMVGLGLGSLSCCRFAALLHHECRVWAWESGLAYDREGSDDGGLGLGGKLPVSGAGLDLVGRCDCVNV